MTRYTVVWHDDALNLLAEVWIASAERGSITEAAQIVDIELSYDPKTKGIDVEGDLRELVVPSLRVLFSVSESDRLVRVVHVEAT